MMNSHPKKPLYLITGAAGLVGYRFSEFYLKNQSASIIGVDQNSHFIERKEHASLPFERTIDRNELFSWLESHHPKLDGIIHLGACTNTLEMDWGKLRFLNLDYSKKLWTWASAHQVPFFYASSAATYGEGLTADEPLQDRESELHRLKPLNPYGESKHLFDLWALEQESQGISPPSWAGFKFFNVYGYGEAHKGPMASFVFQAFQQIQKTREVRLFKSHRDGFRDGEQKRDFIDVRDLIRQIDQALQKPVRRGIYNAGSGQARTFLDLARSIFPVLGLKENIQFIDMPEAIRDRYQYFTQADLTKALQAGWSGPTLTLEQGIADYGHHLLEKKGPMG